MFSLILGKRIGCFKTVKESLKGTYLNFWEDYSRTINLDFYRVKEDYASTINVDFFKDFKKDKS